MNGAIIPTKENVETVAYTQGSAVSSLYGNFIRKGNLVYFSIYINGTNTNAQDILTLTNAKDFPKALTRFGGAMDSNSYHGGAVFYINTSGKLYQDMAATSDAKLMSVSGVYEAAG